MEVDRHFKIVKHIMIYSGAWRFPLKVPKAVQVIYDIFSALVQFYHFLFVVTMIVEFPKVLKIDGTLASNNASIWILCGMILVKLAICQSKHSRDLYKRILDDEREHIEEKDEDILKIKMKYIFQTDMLSIYNISSTLLCGTMVVCFARAAYRSIKNSTEEIEVVYKKYPLPFILWLPFDSDEHYDAAFIIHLFADYIGSIYNTVSQMFYLAIITFIVRKLQILQLQFEDFENYFEKFAGERNLNKFDFIMELIKQHNRVISYVEDLNVVFKYIALLDFTLSSLQFAALLYQLLTLGINIDTAWSTAILILMVSQLFFLTWLSNEVKEQSVRLARKIYLCNWYEQEIGIQKLLLLIIIRSQKPLTLSLGPFFEITNDTFLRTIKAAYSYVMLMKS